MFKLDILPLAFHTGCVSASGRLFVGWNNHLHVSEDGGESFRLLHSFPDEDELNTTLVYEDSRGHLYFSVRDRGRLHCSLDNGQSFHTVLDGIGGSIRGFDEDPSGRLYAGGYSRNSPARLYVSDDGLSWNVAAEWDARHIHDVRINPQNDWIYVVMGEGDPKKTESSHAVYRSKDRGTTFAKIVAAPQGNRPLFLPINFSGNTVLLGTDHSEGGNYIAAFEDLGENQLHAPLPVFHLPYDTDRQSGHAFFSFIEVVGGSFFAGARGARESFLLQADAFDKWRIIATVDREEDRPAAAFINASRSKSQTLLIGRSPGCMVVCSDHGGIE